MVFDKIIAYFKLKKLDNGRFFVVEEKDNSVVAIVEQKALEYMLVESRTISEMRNCFMLHSKGWHMGNDEKVYETFVLSEVGSLLYDDLNIQKKGPKFINVLNKMNESKQHNQMDAKTVDICTQIDYYCKRNNIARIYKYNKQELQKSTEDASSLALKNSKK